MKEEEGRKEGELTYDHMTQTHHRELNVAFDKGVATTSSHNGDVHICNVLM